MVEVVGIRFKKAGKIYYFSPGELSLALDDNVIVETARGLEYGQVVLEKKEIEDSQVVSPIKPVLRKATEKDDKTYERNLEKAQEAMVVCKKKVEEHQLEMKLIDVEYTFDNNKVIFYFTAEGRVDFRELVKDLASIFKIRIELRQIGVRDEAKMLGGLGPCGIGLCCSKWLGEFQPVSIKMAKEQNLSLNPTKISGICGRLLCCLKYEQDFYEEINNKLPSQGQKVGTEDGNGVVFRVNVLRETVTVKLDGGDEPELKEYHLEEIQAPKACSGDCPKQKNQPEAPPKRDTAKKDASNRDKRDRRPKKKPRPKQ
ncbi:stage 0 sporulation family protein [Alkalibacter rhizosphaerae]|uniref:Stage 0 sporulation family protein n=1 Tax=Alkalibacter rhizosphaerae TaxID=2815577 RepID=A0A975AHL2_9FIRM|nr:stage 0 sporulation family protein [Alkalibacter rhizosphaerae]QSX07600.1 stage 0 sporulation family protein [Alkalibacter rhizosphaerae]